MRGNSIRQHIIKELEPYLLKCKKYILVLFIVNILLIGIETTTVYIYKYLIDEVIVNRNIRLLINVVIWYLLSFLFQTICMYFKIKATNNILKKLLLSIKTKMWNNILSMSYIEFNSYEIADLKKRIVDDVIVEKFISTHIISYYVNLGKMIIYTFILFRINYKISLVTLIVFPIFLKLTKSLKIGIKRISKMERETFSEYEEWLRNALQGWKEIKTSKVIWKVIGDFDVFWDKIIKLSNIKYVYWFGNRAAVEVKDFFIAKVLIYFLGGIFIIKGQVTIGSIIIFISYYSSFSDSFNILNQSNTAIHEDEPILNRVFEMLSYDNETANSNKDISCNELKADNVSFKYGEELNNVLDSMSFKIREKEKVLIAGVSGSGKSTLIKLLLKLYIPTSGSISLDNTDVSQLQDKIYHKSVGGILQDSIIFNMTIRDNIRLGNPEASDEEIIQACKQAKIGDFIDSLPEKYDTMILENGSSLSGGQKQRLAIARVILQNPNIIIFDEATSSLDINTERTIFDLCNTLFSDKTIIIITYSLEIAEFVDRVIYIKDHKIEYNGSHDEIYENSEDYRRLFTLREESKKAECISIGSVG